MNSREAVHREPTWRDRSNLIIATRIDASDTDVTTEQLWARKHTDGKIEICCIPFFAYNIALGDFVDIDSDYLVNGVTQRSGRYVFRVFFEPTRYNFRESTTDTLINMGTLIEWSSPAMFAVDASSEAHAMSVAAYLQAEEDAGRLIYETGRTD